MKDCQFKQETNNRKSTTAKSFGVGITMLSPATDAKYSVSLSLKSFFI